MADKRFFDLKGPFTLGELAEHTGSTLSDEGAKDKQVSDVASLDNATGDQVSFLDNKKYLSQFKETKAAACFVHPKITIHAPKGVTCLVSANPYKAYALAAQMFYPETMDCEDIHSSAVIGDNVQLGKNCKIGANAVIGNGVIIGDYCDIGANATLSHCILGNNVAIYPGAQIGQRGFGFAIDPATGFTTVPQLGRVIIEDNVEIGANATVDRGSGPDTVIGRGTRIDNLVQIGHNAKTGEYCVMVAQSGISGSTELGNFVMVGGQSGFAGHLKIGDGVQVGAQSGIMRDIPAGSKVMGTPTVPMRQYMKQVALLAKMATQTKKEGTT